MRSCRSLSYCRALIELPFRLPGTVLQFYGGLKMSDGKHSFSMKLFVVDDAPAIRASISSLLTEIGYIVRTANDGFAALAEIRIDIPDILLSDLNMPGMSGFELLDR